MPYLIRQDPKSKKWKIIKETTGEVVGTSDTKEKAQGSVRARYAAENK